MRREKTGPIVNVGELKRLVVANALATGNTFAFHDLFAQVREFSEGTDESAVTPTLLDHLRYLLPDQPTAESPAFKSALELVDRHELENDTIPAALLEETAKQAVARGKFAYAEDAYRLLGIKKEMVALYAQAGEQFLREDRPKHAAMSFFIAANIDQPVGPHYQYLGPELHHECPGSPQKCITSLPVDALVEAGIRLLLSNEALAERLLKSADIAQKKQILGALAVCRDIDLREFASNLRTAVAEFSRIENGEPDDYSSIGPTLLGRPTGTDEAWHYLKELCFEHPIAALCVCMRPVRERLVLFPVIRDGKPLLESLVPPEVLAG